MTGSILLCKLKGVGDKRAAILANHGIETTADLLRFFPRDYLDYSKTTPVAEIEQKHSVAVHVRIIKDASFSYFSGRTLISAQAQDETGVVWLKWFNQPYRRNCVHAGETIYACGQVSTKRQRALLNPIIIDTLPGIIPVYPTIHGIPQRLLFQLVTEAFSIERDHIIDPISEDFRRRFLLLPLSEALYILHHPSSLEDLTAAQKRVAFDNAFFYLLAVEMQRAERKHYIGHVFETQKAKQLLLSKLPFPLTAAQNRVLTEVARDMEAPCPMNRLVQGDVGSGKTVIAMFALLTAALNGLQGVLLAPTEILAQQHYDGLRRMFGDIVCCLTGGMGKKEHDSVCKRIQEGVAKIIVGTHALLQEKVCYHCLGVIVTDEQHRFGVVQRAAISQKGLRPDVLVMSATPIPRTLALLLCGDLDISVIDELPSGRLAVKTSYIPEQKRNAMYEYIRKESESGVQTYIVCPFIEPSESVEGACAEEVYKTIQKKMPAVSVGLLHGKLTPKQKQNVIDDFRGGRTRVLVTTTVIEVGVHVANASIMVIEDSERFGLSQLHQLRGRVGRGARQSYCFLLSDNLSENAKLRIRAMVETNDGFEISRRDLLLRGPGDFFGTRQHGEGDAIMQSFQMNMELISEIKEAIDEIMALPTAQNNEMLRYACQRYELAFQRIAMN